MIERLIILPNIPAATKKDPVWWVPLIVKNPFVRFSYKGFPFSNLMVTRAAFDKNRIEMGDGPSINQIKTEFDFAEFLYSIKNYIDDCHHHRQSNKWIVKDLRDAFLQVIPSREMRYFVQQAESSGMTIDDILEESAWETEVIIMRAYKKARQARFDHGQTPEVKSAG